MSKQRRTADDFVRDIKAKQSTAPPATSSAKPAKGVSRTPRRLRDHNGQQLAYIYFESEPGRRSAAKLLTKDEASKNSLAVAVNSRALN